MPAPSVAQSVSNNDWTGTTKTTLTATLTTSPGSVLYAVVGCDDTSFSGMSISDSVSGAYAQIGAVADDTTRAKAIGQFFVVNSGSGSTTVTATFATAAAHVFLVVFELKGIDTHFVLDGFSTNIQTTPATSADAVTSGLGFHTFADVLLVSVSQNVHGTAAPSAGTGFTSQGTDATASTRWESKNTQGGALVTGAATYTSSDAAASYITVEAFFKPAPFIQQVVQSKDFTTTTHGTFTNAITMNVGSTCWVVVTWDITHATSVTVSDNINGAYTQIGATQTDSTDAQAVAHFYRANVAGSAVTITATFHGLTSLGAFIAIEASEVRGVTTTMTPIGANAGNQQQTPTTTANAVTSTASTSNTYDSLLAAYSQDVSGSLTPAAGTGFTSEFSDATAQVRIESAIVVATATSKAATFTAGDNKSHVTVAVWFNAIELPFFGSQPDPQRSRTRKAIAVR